MKISDILRHKGSDVVTASPADPVTALLARLAEHNIGALPVCEGERVAGIVSERDVVRRLDERGPSVLDGTVADLMTSDVVSCGSTDTVDSVAETMTQRRIRHMPVIDDGALVGIVTIGDVVLSRTRELEDQRSRLEQYITG